MTPEEIQKFVKTFKKASITYFAKVCNESENPFLHNFTDVERSIAELDKEINDPHGT